MIKLSVLCLFLKTDRIHNSIKKLLVQLQLRSTFPLYVEYSNTSLHKFAQTLQML